MIPKTMIIHGSNNFPNLNINKKFIWILIRMLLSLRNRIQIILRSINSFFGIFYVDPWIGLNHKDISLGKLKSRKKLTVKKEYQNFLK